MSKGQVSAEARVEYGKNVYNIPTKVQILGTNRFVNIRGIKPYTIEKLTKLWLQRDIQQIEDSSSGTLKSMCKDPYFSIKEACILSLNSWWKLILVYPIKWRIWAFLWQYTESQVSPIIQEGKKKLPLTEHWINMVFLVDMRNDWKKMTSKEAEQYRAELLSVAKQSLSANSQVSEEQNGG